MKADETENYDAVIIGGGPAGMAAAAAMKQEGIDDLLILERDAELGGILNQCIHSGFGLHTFREELTGPEYAARYVEMIDRLGIAYELESMVTDINAGRTVTVMSRRSGLRRITGRAVILAMGCRERPRGALGIPGYRPAGIYTAGTAQRLVNREGLLPGREVVILGSGDIGLIMARRMTLEGAHVKMVVEMKDKPGGLARNVVQCLDDFEIPLRLNRTVTEIHGRRRICGVTVAKIGGDGRITAGTEEYVPCDTLLLSVGLIPENELTKKLGARMDLTTRGPVTDQNCHTTAEGVFACGNVRHVHDLVDNVSREAAKAGIAAAAYLKGHGV